MVFIFPALPISESKPSKSLEEIYLLTDNTRWWMKKIDKKMDFLANKVDLQMNLLISKIDELTWVVKDGIVKYMRAQGEKFTVKDDDSIKSGMMEGTCTHTELAKLLRFQSAQSKDKLVSLAEYVKRMKDNQEIIYFVGAGGGEDEMDEKKANKMEEETEANSELKEDGDNEMDEKKENKSEVEEIDHKKL